MSRYSTLFISFISFLIAGHVSADPLPDEDPFEKAAAVNEGTLNLLAHAPDEPAHHHVNRLTISEKSLISGWVGMDQCHYHIDPVPRAEIVFTAGRVRNLDVTHHEGIARASVEAHSVQLEDIGHGAMLCIGGETLGIERQDGTYVLRNGPFMRRFLDGYYPMHVTLEVSFPERLTLVDQVPAAQPGLRVEQAPGHARLDIWFEGILETRLFFRPGETR